MSEMILAAVAITLAVADRLTARGSWRPGRNGSSLAHARRAIQRAMWMNCIVDTSPSLPHDQPIPDRR
jgi:hypothetical protein